MEIITELGINYIDLLLAIPLIYGFIKGLRRGLVFEVASVVALILGLWGAIHFSSITSTLLSENLGWNFEYLNIVSLIITFVAIVIVVHFVARFIDKVVNMVALEFINKGLGGIFGVLKITLILGIVIYLFNLVELNLGFISTKALDESVLYNGILNLTDKVLPMIHFDSVKDPAQDIIKQI